tara:strand:- start:653 stop:2044 length:1392 start_codon:yes stop_codon:yes gene_type:complete
MIELIITVALKSELPPSIEKDVNCTILTRKNINDIKQLPSTFIFITGVGIDNSKQAIEKLIQLNPKHIINIGTAGALSKSVKKGRLYSISSCIKKDTAVPLHYPLTKMIPLKKASLWTAPKPIKNYSSIADLVDMEAYEQAYYCERKAIPFTSIKYVSDYVEESSLDAFKQELPNCQKTIQSLLLSLLKKDNYTISVIIPTFNRENYIKRAVESVLKQDYANKEILVINDGSSDKTLEVLKPYKDQIKLISHEKTLGISAARNTGIKHSKGNWIAFLDSDDEWNKDKLTTQVDFIRKNSFYNIIQSEEDWVRNDKPITQKKHLQKKGGWIFKDLLNRCSIAASNILIHHSIFNTIGYFDTQLPVCEDYDLWCRIARHYPIGLVPHVGHIRYAGHNDQLSSKYLAMDRFRVFSLKKQLKQEESVYFKEMIRKELEKKQKIIDTGAKKRSHKGQTWISKNWIPKP